MLHRICLRYKEILRCLIKSYLVHFRVASVIPKLLTIINFNFSLHIFDHVFQLNSCAIFRKSEMTYLVNIFFNFPLFNVEKTRKKEKGREKTMSC